MAAADRPGFQSVGESCAPRREFLAPPGRFWRALCGDVRLWRPKPPAPDRPKEPTRAVTEPPVTVFALEYARRSRWAGPESWKGFRMPSGQRPSTGLDSRAYAYLERGVNESLEFTYLRAGRDPDLERPHRDGRDITDQPEKWTRYQRARRIAYEARVEGYRARGLI